MYLTILTDGTERNTFVKTAVDGYPVTKLHVRQWITDDGNVGMVFEIDTEEIERRHGSRRWPIPSPDYELGSIQTESDSHAE